MNRTEFLERLTSELDRNNVADVADIVGEYEQHFAFKLADGFTEEEIAAKLGDPVELAAQFGVEAVKKSHKGHALAAAVGYFFAGIVFILLAAWGVVLAAFSLCSAAAAVCLICGLDMWSLIPSMPYGCALLGGVVLAALAVLAAIGCVWFAAFLRQLIRAYGRFSHNMAASASGDPVLPSFPLYPGFTPKAARRLRRVTLTALCVFAVFFIVALAVCMLCAGSVEFWHVWGWFGYAA